jgi:hypothetical protein
MPADIPAQIARLPTLSRRQLLEMWQKLYRRPAPPGIRRELMVPFLAYRMQENVYGGLKASTRAELRRIARDLDKPTGSTEVRTRQRLKPGTRIVREWRGKTHEVSVTESGFEYGGRNYRSLSQIATQITGTRWSGPAFFGLKSTRPKQAVPNE